MEDLYRYRKRFEQAGTRFSIPSKFLSVRVFLFVVCRGGIYAQTSAWRMWHREKTNLARFCAQLLLKRGPTTPSSQSLERKYMNKIAEEKFYAVAKGGAVGLSLIAIHGDVAIQIEIDVPCGSWIIDGSFGSRSWNEPH